MHDSVALVVFFVRLLVCYDRDVQVAFAQTVTVAGTMISENLRYDLYSRASKAPDFEVEAPLS